MKKPFEQPELVLSKPDRKIYDGHVRRYNALNSLHQGLEKHFEMVVRGHVPPELAPQARAIVIDGLSGSTNLLTGASLLTSVSLGAALAPLFFAGWRGSELPAQIRKRTQVMTQIKDSQLVLASPGRALSSRQVQENKRKLMDTLRFLKAAKEGALQKMDSMRA
ncbi:MAG TPA: hypothetical protein VI875_04505 [Candidatus Norongarragalinales archaeon]|nr:hypothetical protein [Candidatus Norongarragalinales archaeon]